VDRSLDRYRPIPERFAHDPDGLHGIAHAARVLVWAEQVAAWMHGHGRTATAGRWTRRWSGAPPRRTASAGTATGATRSTAAARRAGYETVREALACPECARARRPGSGSAPPRQPIALTEGRSR